VTQRLALAAARHPWRAVAAWGAAVVVSIGPIGAFLGDALSGEVASIADQLRRVPGVVYVLDRPAGSSERGVVLPVGLEDEEAAANVIELLTIAFRSIVVAVTAILLNLLSVGAAYGVLILVFQKGVGNELFGFQQVDFIEAWAPLFLFAVLFGLSMDYNVFLLSRIRERYLQTRDYDAAVAHGISSTARLITGAALIIITVFVGFAVGDLVMFQQMGFGVAVSLLLDATIIRSVILPATMKLMGKWNWYLPRRLEWLPHFRVEGAK
jgi:hypothetical protein